MKNLVIYLFQFLKSFDTFFCKSLTMQFWELCTCSWNSFGLLNSFIQILQQTGSISSKIPPKISKFSSSKWSVFKWYSKSGGVRKNLRHSLHDIGWTLISIFLIGSWFETRLGLELGLAGRYFVWGFFILFSSSFLLLAIGCFDCELLKKGEKIFEFQVENYRQLYCQVFGRNDG